MKNLQPCPNCSMHCGLRDSPMCVTNLVSLPAENAPITMGLHVGLNHIYGHSGMPPCVKGSVGEAYWSTAAHPVPTNKNLENEALVLAS